jgi:heme/copper-type cytochrome/quinol oxidase subunit 2
MEKQILDLTEDEISITQELIYEAREFTKTRLMLAVAFALVVSVIPVGFLPRRRFSSSNSTIDQSQSLLEMLGVFNWSIVAIVLLALFGYILLIDKKYFKLKKDIIELKKEVINGHIVKKGSDENYNFYQIHIKDNEGKEHKIKVAKNQYDFYTIGQDCDIEVLKNSRVHL